MKVRILTFVCHCVAAISPILQTFAEEFGPGQKGPVVLPTRTGVDRPSTSWSFHWSNVVILQSPSGIPVRVKVPSAAHLVKAKSSPSGSPTLTKDWVQAKASCEVLP